MRSLLYCNIHVYRWAMNILYGGKYKERFLKVIDLLNEEDRNILELCFGDVIIAEYCRSNNRKWMGMDLNESFVSHALRNGFDAQQCDITTCKELPACYDVCLMIGSLYHFEHDIIKVMKLMLNASKKIILCEPTTNLSHRNDIVGYLSRRYTGAGKGREEFRFTEETLLKTLKDVGRDLGFDYHVSGRSRRDIYVVIKK